MWLALFVTGLTTRTVEAVHPLLPSWFPLLNLALLPILFLIGAASSPIRPQIRLMCWVFTLCSASAMYLAYQTHPVAYSVVLALFLVEAFLVVPRWNRHRRKKLGLPSLGVPFEGTKFRAFDYVVYALAGLVVAACIIYAVLARP